MKSFVALLALVAFVAADVSHVQSANQAAHVVKQETEVRPDGFQYVYETSNGIAGQESGAIRNIGREDESIGVQGSNSYRNPEGELIQLSYTADEFGYHPQGAHLPIPPAIPEYIQRSIEYNAAHQQPEPTRRN